MDSALKKAGAMLAHLDLFHHMLHLRGLLQLAAHMEERGDRVTLISPDTITLIGSEQSAAPNVTTTKGAIIVSGNAYAVLRTLKGHDAPEYAVTREELGALNARAVADIEAGDALRAFADTLTRITAGASAAAPAAAAPTPEAAPASTPASAAPNPERPARPRRSAEAEAGNAEQPAA
ncbi:MAG: multidrug transporter [Deinococcus sp.]|nr:multidrug transporter [Deinococcus sp.]